MPSATPPPAGPSRAARVRGEAPGGAWRRALLGVLLLALARGLPIAQSADDDGPAPATKQEGNDPYPPAFRERVNRAVDRGVARLREAQQSDGTWAAPAALDRWRLGYTALMTLALLAGGTPGDDAAIESAFTAMRPLPFASTYDVATLLLALHARYAGAPDPWIEPQVDGSGRAPEDAPCAGRLTPEDRAWMQRGVDYLLAQQTDGHWRYPEDGLDLSNTQFALLGLWAAARCGLEVPEAAWMSSLSWLLSVQERTGRPVDLHVNEVRGDYRVVWIEKARARGFRYRDGEPVTGSMTTAGMAGIAICQEHLWSSRRMKPALRQRVRKALRDGMAWMQDNFTVAHNPGAIPPESHHTYYLYGMERAGLLARFRFMGRYDWYLEGATWLLETQQSNGSWNLHDYLRDTAFAILFLKRSAGRLRNPVITPR
jgi:hypothetical protein